MTNNAGESNIRWILRKLFGWKLNGKRSERADLPPIATTCNSVTAGSKYGDDLKRARMITLPSAIELICKIIRKRWLAQSRRRRLDVTFEEAADRTANEKATYSHDIIRKIPLHIPRRLHISRRKPTLKWYGFV